MNTKKVSQTRKRIGAVMLVVTLLCFAVVLSVTEDSERSSLSTARAVTVALCEQRMTTHLCAPETADYPFFNVGRVIALNDNHHRLESYVDSENDFGGQVRTHFICSVQGNDLAEYRIVQFVIQ